MTEHNIKEDDVVFCTVKKIESGSVFVDIDNNGEGSIILPEIAAGRIRNLRAHVTLNKKIVCKVLKVDHNRIELSLRRVTAKEREEVLDNYKKERSLVSLIKTIAKNPEEIIKKIKEVYKISEFLERIKEEPIIAEQFLPKLETQKLLDSLKEKSEKEKIVKRTFTLSTNSPAGLLDIKEILKIAQAKIRYMGSSKFEIQKSAPSFKEAEHALDNLMIEIEKQAKQKHAFFSTKEQKK